MFMWTKWLNVPNGFSNKNLWKERTVAYNHVGVQGSFRFMAPRVQASGDRKDADASQPQF